MPLAESASKMYFVITDLSKINNMYRFSLASFLRLFQRALQAKKVTGCHTTCTLYYIQHSTASLWSPHKIVVIVIYTEVVDVSCGLDNTLVQLEEIV